MSNNAWPTPPKWGPWKYEEETLVLTIGRYEVDLEKMESSAQMLDRIMQVSTKQWATDAVVAGLIHALNDCFDPQRNFCSFGIERTTPVFGDPLRRQIADRLAQRAISENRKRTNRGITIWPDDFEPDPVSPVGGTS